MTNTRIYSSSSHEWQKYIDLLVIKVGVSHEITIQYSLPVCLTLVKEEKKIVAKKNKIRRGPPPSALRNPCNFIS